MVGAGKYKFSDLTRQPYCIPFLGKEVGSGISDAGYTSAPRNKEVLAKVSIPED